MSVVQDTATPNDPIDITHCDAKKKRWCEAVPFALVVLVACLVFFFGLGKFPLFNPDEALYADPAAEMLETGNYITTTLNYAVRFTKPPLSIWMMAASCHVFGVNEFAVRFPGAVCGMLLIAFTYLFLRRYAGKKAALIGSFSLVTAPLFVATAREAITDMPLSLFIATSMMCFYHAKSTGKVNWLWAAYILLGLATMTKGPVGVILPILILFTYHLLKRDLKQAISFYRPIIGFLIVSLISLPWFVVEISITKGAYFRDFILRENFQRYTSVVDSHKGAWWYHLVAMLGGYFPWSVFIPQAFVGTIKAWLAKDLSEKDSLRLFALCWALITLVFFSTSVSKLIPYTVPAFPALAIMLALELSCVFESKRYLKLAVPLAILATIYGGANIALPIIWGKLRHVPVEILPMVYSYTLIQASVSAVAAILALLRRPKIAIGIFSSLTLIATTFLGYKSLQILSYEWEGPILEFCQYIKATNTPYFVYKIRKPSVTFYIHRPAAMSPNQENLTSTVEEQLAKLKNAYVIANDTDQKYFTELPHSKILLHQGRFILVKWSK